MSTPTIQTPYPAWLTPAGRAVWQAVTHIYEQTLADTTPEERQAIRHDPQVTQAQARVDQRAASGDVQVTQTAAQAWNTAVREALKRTRARRG
jgi:hypothetical protein